MLVHPLTLCGEHVTLDPLAMTDHDGLVTAAQDGQLWELSYASVPRPEGMEAEIARRLARQEAGEMVPFTARRSRSGEVLGMTSYLHLDEANRRLEIGATWIAASAQRSAVNTECKLLLLTHAFDDIGVLAVEFRTHWLNRQSRAAIERLGAKLDGILRQHQILPDGTVRDTAVYSVVAAEWPAVRGELRRRIGAGTTGPMAVRP